MILAAFCIMEVLSICNACGVIAKETSRDRLTSAGACALTSFVAYALWTALP